MDVERSAAQTPGEIEKRSFEIIARELEAAGLSLDAATTPVVTRVIHATADFEFAHTLRFSPDAMAAGLDALRAGAPIVTDTQMARAGINRSGLLPFGSEVHCHIADADVAETAAALGCTRSRAAADKAAGLWTEAIYVVGNAPTALVRILELAAEGLLRPRLIVGVPVGFVNVVESKELLAASAIPHIVAMGRKGGSTVAAAICNALSSLARAEAS